MGYLKGLLYILMYLTLYLTFLYNFFPPFSHFCCVVFLSDQWNTMSELIAF